MPAIVCAGAGLWNAAVSARNHAFMVIVTTNTNKKNILSVVKDIKSFVRKPRNVPHNGYMHLQELACGLLQPDQEVDNDIEERELEKRDRYVNECEREGLCPRMVHRRLEMS